MNLEVRTPDKKLFEGKVNSLKVPGSKGAFMILKNHAPIISTLDAGILEISSKIDGIKEIEITGGVIEVQQNNVIVLAENL